jgi:membrane peptidoglycan carboxypeptidase
VPHNYDLEYHGRVTLRSALANSYNVPAVKTFYSLGSNRIQEVLKTANSMGYYLKDQNPKDLGLAMTLGTGEGKLLDEVNAYSVFANQGVYRPYMPILAIYKVQPDGSRKLVWKYKAPKGTQVLAPQYTYLITNILSDVQAKYPAFGSAADEYLSLGNRPVASKTGTTSDFKDNLTLGYTPDVVTGVWVGNPDDSPMPNSTGITGAAPAWHEFMYDVTQNTSISQFIQPTGIVTATVARYAPVGQEPGLALNGNGVTDIFAAGTVPTTVDNPSQDDYSGSAQAGEASPNSQTTTTTSPGSGSNSSTPCGGGQYSITTTTVNGQTYEQLVCK